MWIGMSDEAKAAEPAYDCGGYRLVEGIST